MFSSCTVPPYTKATKLGNSDQEASATLVLLPPSAGKNTRLVLMSCCAWKCVPVAISSGVIFPRSLGVICYDRWVLSDSHINYFKDWCLMTSQPTFLFLLYSFNSANLAILSKGCKPDDFELHNSVKLSFTNIWGLCSNFVDCESFLELNSPGIFAVWDKPGWINWF